MLERIGILAGSRRELRRDVRLACDVTSPLWDEGVPHRLVDLSPSGGFVESLLPLGPGDEIEVSFTPPRSRASYRLRARVVRTSLGRRREKDDVPGMGVQFVDLSPGDRAALAAQLVGIPPRVPTRKKSKPKRSGAPVRLVEEELVWIEEIHVEPANEVESDVSRAMRSALDDLDPRGLVGMVY